MATNKEIVDGLIASSNGSNETSSKISQALLDQLKDNYALEEGTGSGQIKDNSIFDKVQEQTDIDGETETDSEILQKFSDLLNSNGYAKDLWNESIKSGINYFVNRFLSDEAIIPIDPNSGLGKAAGGFAIKDIKQADAGLSFEGTPWVKPNYNIDNDTYDEVRGNDKIEPVLNNFKNLQFTHSQINQKTGEKLIDDGVLNKYLRLLMPKYIRRVEVEDLNRNFWVLGQTISAISAFLFDDDSPIANMFKRLISEINQLWENVLYLWVSQNKPITKVHSEVLYLPNNSSSTETKFDNFDQTPTFDNITERLNYLVDQYSDSNLCIVPIIRRGNYYKNYYSIEQYNGIWFYDRNKSEWFYCTPTNGSNGNYGNYDTTDSGVQYLQIKPDKDKTGGIYLDEDNFTYKYYYPLSDITSLKELQPKRYFAGIRTVPIITCEYNPTTGFKGSLKLDCQDYTLIISSKGNYKEIYLWNFSNITGQGTFNTTKSSTGALPQEGTSTILNIEKGYDLSEMPSSNIKSKENTVGLAVRTLGARPIKNRLLDFFSSNLNSSPMSNLKNNTNNIIQQLSGDEKIATLRVGYYRVDGSLRSAGNGSSGSFWALDNGTEYTLHEYNKNKFGNENSYYQVFEASSTGVSKVNFANDTNPAIAFRGSLYIGAQLILPDFGEDIKVNYPNYVSWQSVTPIVDNNGVDTESDTIEANTHHVVIGLNQEPKTDASDYGRQYQNYHIYEFFAKNPEEEYGPTNWVIRYSQISVLFGPEITESYEQSFWGTASLDYSKFKEGYYYFNNGALYKKWPGLVARVAIHYFSVNENNESEYFRKEYNRLYQNGTKLAWRNSSSWSTTGDSSLEAIDNQTPKIRKASFNYYDSSNFNFIDNPINGYSN